MAAKSSRKIGTKRAPAARVRGNDKLIEVVAEQDREFSRIMAAIDATLDEIEQINRRTSERFR